MTFFQRQNKRIADSMLPLKAIFKDSIVLIFGPQQDELCFSDLEYVISCNGGTCLANRNFGSLDINLEMFYKKADEADVILCTRVCEEDFNSSAKFFISILNKYPTKIVYIEDIKKQIDNFGYTCTVKRLPYAVQLRMCVEKKKNVNT